MSRNLRKELSELPRLSRRAWLKMVGGSAAASMALFACVNNKNASFGPADAPTPDAPAGCALTNAKTTIMNNHDHAPHVLVVTSDQVKAGVAQTYSIMGMAAHDHMVTITAEQFQMLQAAGTVMDDSTVMVCHHHTCVISCG
jgi:hypothetical protein